MRILHYFLGFHRQGGLNRYAGDLARAQQTSGDQVYCLFPEGGLPHKVPTIRKSGMIGTVNCYKLKGGTSLPLLEGIRDPQMILDHPRIPPEELMTFCGEVRPEILHVHTWMGFPPELLTCLKSNGTRIIFTTHDYFGLCPKVNLIDEQGLICTSPSDQHCTRCNHNAPGANYLALRNWSFLFQLKKYLRPLQKLIICRTRNVTDEPTTVKEYMRLRSYYLDLLRQCDLVHFNSETTRKIYLSAIPELSGKVIGITHAGISNHSPTPRRINAENIRLTFCGSTAPYKGLPMLLRVLQKIADTGNGNWHLDIWGSGHQGVEDGGRIHYCGNYSESQQKEVFSHTDLLIVPSIWHETFGFVVSEALSFGVPVLCSDMVGAQSLVNASMIFHGEDGLQTVLTRFLNQPELLSQINNGARRTNLLTIQEHRKQIYDLYRDLLSK